MKIKKLTIHGFKSFADRTVISFSDGTSAVVGPNGCGKSNIVDAIRWVLGEHNARHLRGKQMEDLIFGGSDKRKASGMAEVTLTLSNEAGKAPAAYANFTEIEIQRRLYRDGDSEYYINKVQARLKDIVELFRDTGIGTRAYSIIEQGQVGWLVTAKPEERRAIFEEAAGINKFKHKKDTALRKLDQTKDNLTRVTDIINEVRRQLNSLNRQAKKAERYKVFKDELQGADLYLSHLESGKIETRQKATTTKLTEIEDHEIELSKELASKESTHEEIRLDYLKKESEFKELRDRAFELERHIEREERSREIATLRTEEITRNAERLTREIDELTEDTRRISGELEVLRREDELNRRRVEEEKARLTKDEGVLTEMDGRIREKEGALKVAEAGLLEDRTRLSDIRYTIQGSIKEEERLRAFEATRKNDAEAARTELSEKTPPLNAIREALNIAGENKQATSNSLRISTERLVTLKSEEHEKNDRLKTLKESLAASGARLKTLEEMEMNLDGLRDGARAIMQSRGEHTGVHGLLADAIEAHHGYEKAVEAALGESLQYVMVESQSAGIEAIEYLKTHSTGRGTFVPINGVRIPSEESAASRAGAPEGTTFLKNEVSVKDGFSPIVDYLLDGVLVVKDLGQAVEIWNMNGCARTFVTTDGELLNPEGMVTGGYSNGSDGGMLVKRTQIKELTSEIEETRRTISTLESELLSIETAIAESTTEAEGHKEELYTKDIEEINKEGELKRLTDAVEHINDRIQSALRDLTATEAELEAIKIKKIDLAKEREGLEEACTRREGAIAGLSHETSALREQREKTSIGTTEIKVLLAAVEERFEHTAHKIEDKERLTSDMTAKEALKAEEIASGKVETEELQLKVEGHKETLEGLLVKKDQVSREVVLEEETLSQGAKRIQEFEGSIKKIQSETATLQTSRGELTLETKELDMSLTNLKEKTIERYGVSLEDYTPTEDMEGIDLTELGGRVTELREKIGKMGEVSLGALEEFTELETRYNFLIEQESDLNQSIETLKSAITRINRTTRERFKEAFEAISKEFSKNFPRFFSGGKAKLVLTGDGDILDQGVEIVAQPPGKRLQNINLLSGGEKALTATALIFSIFLIKPSPFCLLDEVDAPLDDANIDRFNGFVTEMSKNSQFILITHNKRTMEMADTLFGITMAEPGVSRIVSVDL